MSLKEIISKYSSKSVNTVYVRVFESPVGKVTEAADGKHLLIVSFQDSKNFEKMLRTVAENEHCSFVEENNKVLVKFEKELAAYFDGKLNKFTVPVKTIGSDFQKEVWSSLRNLPYGSTQTYGELAESMGRPTSHSRAVGAACGANAHLLVIPCHRLVASGSKGGFSAGVDRKSWLIQHEKKHTDRGGPFLSKEVLISATSSSDMIDCDFSDSFLKTT